VSSFGVGSAVSAFSETYDRRLGSERHSSEEMTNKFVSRYSRLYKTYKMAQLLVGKLNTYKAQRTKEAACNIRYRIKEIS
jgi:3-hydroxy-3-methylglutaryl CoA synthase